MIGDRARPEAHVVRQEASTSRDQRPSRGLTVWFTGLSAAGKSTVAAELERRLFDSGRPAYRLDGDNLRHGLNADLVVARGCFDESSVDAP